MRCFAPEATGSEFNASKPDLQKGGPPMDGTQQRPTSASYRDAVRELIESGAPFGDVEDAIDELACPTTDDKAALWLLAFSCAIPAGTSSTHGVLRPASLRR